MSLAPKRSAQAPVNGRLKFTGSLASTKLNSSLRSVVVSTMAALPETFEGAPATWPAGKLPVKAKAQTLMPAGGL